MRVAKRMTTAALGLLLAGCGVQPTGVIGAGEPATGLTRGVRLYFASGSGLQAVPVLDRKITDLSTVVKLLDVGPSPAEQRAGLVDLVEIGGYAVTGRGTEVTLSLEEPYGASGRDQGTGQLVCTLARAQSVLEPEVRTEDVRVTLRPRDGEVFGPYRCSEFLNG
ncbi:MULTISPECIES: GerMN domain-containing protein [unclassified Streptomyces]|uniref:GerMN domain-containing protein n=1 Tax=unclassified Streptomyces TaxID=2593676 RepID=UPI001660E6B8|nr:MULTISPECIES: GerMN domain-containing protein [unclassified Streptomyces]MBD0710460.1 hypothetical protein [Streptomyces sp. CBMA291]MBD0712795.1 hypothetical protein [Streptomyces sp. CBMA370]